MGQPKTAKPNNLSQKDYRNDGYCDANRYQEKDCLYFKQLETVICRYPNICALQGIGKICRYREEKNEN